MSFVNLQVIEKNKQKRAYKKQWALFLCLTNAIMGHVHAPGKHLSHLARPYNCTITTWLKLTSDDTKEQSYKMAKKFLISWFPEKSAWFWERLTWCYTSMFCDMQLKIEFLSQKTCSWSSWEYPYFTEAAVLLKHLKWNRKDKNAKLLLILIENHNHWLAWYRKAKWVFPFNWK